MTDTVVSIENLGKVFRPNISKTYSRASEKLMDMLQSPLQLLRRQPPSEQDHFWALRNISLEVKRGEVIGLIGRNGAGKSTLLKILSRITDPTEGRATIRGRLGSLLEVGVGFHPELTGRENIYLNGAILGMKRNEITARLDQIIEFAEVEQFIDMPIKRYSSGMYVRLAFAVAAHLEPDILIVDEVLAVGDASFQKKCLGKVSDVSRQEGRTVFFVTHDMAALNSLCHRAAILHKGRLEAIGPASEMVSRYLSGVFNFDDEHIDRLRPKGYGIDVKFTDLRIRQEDGNLCYGDPVEVIAVIQSNKHVRGLSVGTTIISRAGVPIMTFFGSETFSIEAGEKKLVRLTASNLTLVPGQYYARCTIGRGGADSPRYDLDVIDGRPTFQILPVSSRGDMAFDWRAERWGHVAPTDVVCEIESLQCEVEASGL